MTRAWSIPIGVNPELRSAAGREAETEPISILSSSSDLKDTGYEVLHHLPLLVGDRINRLGGTDIEML